MEQNHVAYPPYPNRFPRLEFGADIRGERLSRVQSVLAAAGLGLLVLIIYAQMGSHAFINFDDPLYVTENAHVSEGITTESVLWALTTFHSANWHPLTWLSHMVDVSFFGMDPGAHHLVNVMFHLFNTWLVFFLLYLMTGCARPSLMVAALFAVHPLHVESVAWVSERKDVLSTLLGLLTTGAWLRYVRCSQRGWYAAALLFYILGLMAKPMLVTLPFALLLLDNWPLKRWVFENGPRRALASAALLIREKIPLFLLSGASCTVTWFAQKSAGAVAPLEALPFGVRSANAAISYMVYLQKTFWPSDLAIYYPFVPDRPIWHGIAALVVIVVATAAAVSAHGKRPWITVGWLWYLGTLIPVIGLVQVGSQAMADRYTYIPLIGVFWIVAWSLEEAGAGSRFRRSFAGVVSASVLTGLTLVSVAQAARWTDDLILFKHTLRVTPPNPQAHFSYGIALSAHGRTDEAIAHFRKAVQIQPLFEEAGVNLGNQLLKKGRVDEAVAQYETVLKDRPESAQAHFNLANALCVRGEIERAISHYIRALRIQPVWAGAHNNLGIALARSGKPEAAAVHFREALRLDPGLMDARDNLRTAEKQMAAVDLKEEALEEKARLRPEDPDGYLNLGRFYKETGRYGKAAAALEKALTVGGDLSEVRIQMALVTALDGHLDEAARLLEKMIDDHPDLPDPCYYLAAIRARQKRIREALNWLEMAAERGFAGAERLKADANFDAIRDTEAFQRLVEGLQPVNERSSAAAGPSD